MSNDANGLTVDERRALRAIYDNTLRVAEDLGRVHATTEMVQTGLSRLEGTVDATRIEVVKQGQLISVLTGECSTRGELCRKRFSKQSVEMDRLHEKMDAKVGRLEDTTGRIQILDAREAGARIGWKRSWTVLVAVVGWVIAVTGLVLGVILRG
jgi:hypothetical protein